LFRNKMLSCYCGVMIDDMDHFHVKKNSLINLSYIIIEDIW
jgi:hypothetical protein